MLVAELAGASRQRAQALSSDAAGVRHEEIFVEAVRRTAEQRHAAVSFVAAGRPAA
jgi:hypothetical protein